MCGEKFYLRGIGGATPSSRKGRVKKGGWELKDFHIGIKVVVGKPHGTIMDSSRWPFGETDSVDKINKKNVWPLHLSKCDMWVSIDEVAPYGKKKKPPVKPKKIEKDLGYFIKERGESYVILEMEKNVSTSLPMLCSRALELGNNCGMPLHEIPVDEDDEKVLIMIKVVKPTHRFDRILNFNRNWREDTDDDISE